MELQARLCRIELQIERRSLGGPLLLAGQLCEALGERIGDEEVKISEPIPQRGLPRDYSASYNAQLLLSVGSPETLLFHDSTCAS